MDVLGITFYETCCQELCSRVGKKRYEHVLGVASEAQRLARIYGYDERHARLAGLLHDWDKGYDDEAIRLRAHELGLTIDPFVAQHMPRVLHGMTAACALAREFPNIPDDVIQAIDRHTIAAYPMDPLDMIIYIADALEPTRSGSRVDMLRTQVGKLGLEALFIEVYRHWLVLMLERGLTLHPNTLDIWNSWMIHQKDKRT